MGKFFQNIGQWFSNTWNNISSWWNNSVGGLSGLGSALWNNYVDPSGFNAEQAQLDRDWQMQMLQYQNQYNSPEQQMQRARAAGLNPSMLYGQEVATSATPSGGAQASANTGGFNPLQLIAMNLQRKQIDADVADKMASVSLKNSQIPVNERLASLYMDTSKKLEAEIEVLKKDKELKNMLGLEASWRCDILAKNLSFMNETYNAMVAEVNAKSNVAVAEGIFAYRRAKASVDSMQALIDNLKSNKAVNDELKEYYNQMTTNLSKTYDILDKQDQILGKQKDLIMNYGDAKELISMITGVMNSASLMINSIASILAKGQTPQLNVYPNNSVSSTIP